MKAGRWVGVMLLMAGMALVVVYLRAEQARCASRILRSEGQRMAMRSELWELQMAVARLRGPAEVHDRLRRFAAVDVHVTPQSPAASPAPQKPKSPAAHADSSKRSAKSRN